MTSKDEELYARVFKKTKELCNINPRYIITDFEKSLCKYLNLVFNESKALGCYFYFFSSDLETSTKFRFFVAI